MGNQLVGVAPSQIYPVEHYLMGSFESDIQFESRYVSPFFNQFRVFKVRSLWCYVKIKSYLDASLLWRVNNPKPNY